MKMKRSFLRGRLLKYCRIITGSVSTAVAKKMLVRIVKLRKQVRSDAALIESLNRYIEALEGKAAVQAELIQELRGHLSGIVPQKEGTSS